MGGSVWILSKMEYGAYSKLIEGKVVEDVGCGRREEGDIEWITTPRRTRSRENVNDRLGSWDLTEILKSE